MDKPAFLVDENLPGKLADELVARGFQAEFVADNPAIRSSPDEDLMKHARLHGLAMVSKDKVFADITRYPPGTHMGVVSVRLPNKMGIDHQVEFIVSAICKIDPEELRGSLVIVEAGRVRIRKAK